MKKNNNAFSMVELIAVIVIIGIIVLMLSPYIIKFVAKSQKNICDHNIVEIQNCFMREAAENLAKLKIQEESDKLLNDIMDNKDGKYFSKKITCPCGGEYVEVYAGSDKKAPVIACKIHSEGVIKVQITTKDIIARYMELAAENDIDAIRKLLGVSNTDFSNDSFRGAILEELGGNYEPLSKEIKRNLKESLGGGSYLGDDLYVSPYVMSPSADVREMMLIATPNKDNSGTNLWAATAVCDVKTGTWYQYFNNKGKADEYGVASYNTKSYADLMNEINKHPESWKALN